MQYRDSDRRICSRCLSAIAAAILLGLLLPSARAQEPALQIVPPAEPQRISLWVGEAAIQTLTVKNVTAQDLKLAGVSFVSSDAKLPEEAKKIRAVGLDGVTLPAGATTQIGVAFPAHSQAAEYGGALYYTLSDKPGPAVSFCSLNVRVEEHYIQFLSQRSARLVALAITVVFVAFTLLIRRGKSGLGFFQSPDGGYSVSKFQAWLWALVVMCGYVYVFLRRGAETPIPPNVWLLLGISGASSVVAKFIAIGKSSSPGTEPPAGEAQAQGADAGAGAPAPPAGPAAPPPAKPPQADATPAPKPQRSWLVSMLSDDDQLSLMRLQMFGWTVITTGLFVIYLLRNENLWNVPEGLLWLMGISHAGYIGDKGAAKSGS
ncbi:MAG TPA: hypothetical protein VFD30_06175 [Terriglobia bacterium]|nr:hypothetical protein [Terriglobia bacterium]